MLHPNKDNLGKNHLRLMVHARLTKIILQHHLLLVN